MNRNSYSRILKALYICALLRIVLVFFHHTGNDFDTFIHRENRETYEKCLKSDLYQSNLTYNFLHHSHNNSTNEILTIKPIMHTYIDPDYVDKELLDFWMNSWKDAGWEIRILLPRDALNHTHYTEFHKLLKKNKICCVPRQTYLRHLAMSTVKEGGFYSESYVFPLRSDLYLQSSENVTIPNEGNFTSWDGIQGSLMSGSHNEWNRMTKLLMETIKKNVVLSFMEISDESCDTYNHENLVSDPTMLLSGRQFKVDLCQVFKKYLAIRFHPHDIKTHKINIKDRLSIVSSWFKIYKARCVNDRPVIFTFFEPVSQLVEEEPHELLNVWKQSWRDQGWEPVILTMGDAKRHPNYNYFHKVLADRRQFRNNNDRYNYFCFMRWVAISASGGGWLADYDTFPLNLPANPNHTLPNNGEFTGYADFVPNLLSGSLSQWNKMIKLIFEKLAAHDKSVFYSDMLAAQDIVTSNTTLFLTERSSGQVDNFYREEIANPETKWRRINPYDFSNKCHLANLYTSVHFSHMSCSKMWFCREGAHEGVDGNHITHLRRGEVAKKWLDSWKSQCGTRALKKKVLYELF